MNKTSSNFGQGKLLYSKLVLPPNGCSAWGTDTLQNNELAVKTTDESKLRQLAAEILAGHDIGDFDGEILRQLVENRKLPFSDALELTRFSNNFHLTVYSLLCRPDATAEVLEHYRSYQGGDFEFLFNIIANHPNITDSMFLEMVRSHVSKEAVEAVMTGRLSEDFLEGLSHSEDFRVREAVAKITKTPKILAQMSAYKIPFVRNAIARNPHTEIQVVEKLAAEPDCPEVVVTTVKSGRLSEDFLEGLSHSEDFHVRGAVAQITKNPKLLEQMSAYKIPFVRNAIVLNPHTEIQVIEKLAAEPDCHLAKLEAAKRSANAKLLTQLGNSLHANYNADLADALMRNKNTPDGVRVLAKILRP